LFLMAFPYHYHTKYQKASMLSLRAVIFLISSGRVRGLEWISGAKKNAVR
jgi:hypothetical protein